MKKEESRATNTMGVTISDGQLYLLYNKDFVESILEKYGTEKLKGILEHELLHIVYDHLSKCKKFNRIPMVYNIACIPKGETLITPKGTSKVENIKIGDTLFDSKGTSTVKETVKRNFKGNLYKLYFHNCLPITVTEEHPILVSKESRIKNNILKVYSTPQFVKAKDLIVKEKYLSCHFGVVPINKKEKEIWLNLAKFYGKNKDALRNQHRRKIAESIRLDKELAWIMGFYVAEGSAGQSNLNTFIIPNKDKSKLNRVCTYFKKLGYNPSYWLNKNNGVYRLTVCSSVFAKAFSEWFGRGAHNKKIPPFIFRVNKKILRSFMEGLIDGDGCRIKHSFVVYTVSKSLVLQLQLLLAKLGILGAVRQTYNDPSKYKVFCKTKSVIYSLYSTFSPKITNRVLQNRKVKSYSRRWKIKDRYIITPLLKVERMPYEGKVYNFETTSHNYCYNNVVNHNSDMSINQMINKSLLPDKLPVKTDKGVKWIGELVTPQAYKLPIDKDAEFYYNELTKQMKKSGSGSGKGKCSKCRGSGKTKDSKGKEQECPNCGGTGQTQGQTLDDHSMWEKIQENDQMTKEVIKRAVKEAYQNAKKLRGYLPSHLEEAINELLKPPTVNWRQLLKQYIGASIKTGFKSSWKRPNRRYPFREEYKGKTAKRTIRIMLAVDTSGSISSEDFVDFMSEMRGILNVYKCKIDVVQCDAEIQEKTQLHPYSKLNIKFKGRGGTSFIPVFKLFNNVIDYDMLIYFSDMWGDESECHSQKPVIWVTTRNYNKNTKPGCGRIVNIND